MIHMSNVNFQVLRKIVHHFLIISFRQKSVSSSLGKLKFSAKCMMCIEMKCMVIIVISENSFGAYRQRAMYFLAFCCLNLPALKVCKDAHSCSDISGIQKGNWSLTLSNSEILTLTQSSWLDGLGGWVRSKL